MEGYPLRYYFLFRVCRFIQDFMDVSSHEILGIKFDIVSHFLVPILLYLILSVFFTQKTSMLFILVLIFLKELNDFYVYYYHQDIQLKFILSNIRDLLISSAGILLCYLAVRFRILRLPAFLKRIKTW